MTWIYWWAGNDGDQSRYRQFDVNGCAAGCGPVAWAMLFGWADRKAHAGDAYWWPRTGLYLANGGRGADAVAPVDQDAGINNIIVELRGEVHTFCMFGQGATAPWDMSGATAYLSGRTGTRLEARYNAAGFHEDYLRDRARDSIRDRHTPAVIGTGWLTHYPLAYAYAEETRIIRNCFFFACWDEVQTSRCFKVNNGWGGGGSTAEWIPASTWFAGEIFP